MMRQLSALFSVLFFGSAAVAYAIANGHEVGDIIEQDCDAAALRGHDLLPNGHWRWDELQGLDSYVRMCEAWHRMVWGEVRL